MWTGKPNLIVLQLLGLIITNTLAFSSSRIGKATKGSSKVRSIGTLYDLHPQVMKDGRDRRDVSVNPVIKSMDIVSRVSARFSETHVISVVHNPSNENKEAIFSLQIPEQAFISNFTMIIDKKLIIAEVKSKKEAKEMYNEAKASNQTAGLVSSEPPGTSEPTPDGMEVFAVAIAVKANSSIEFELTYLQLLERYNGMFEQVISMRPNQLVENFKADIFVYDTQGVKDLRVFEPSVGGNGLEYEIALVKEDSEYLKHISFNPTINQQKQMDNVTGLNGDFVVSYDVNHGDDAGLIQIEDNKYFAHYFSPKEENFTPLSKNIIFVIDISGSMSGEKMNQTREAMQTILGQLDSSDMFMMILFDNMLDYWPSTRQPVVASASNVNSAQTYAYEKLYADGSTNIDDAVNTACSILRKMKNPIGSNLVVFLTDGEPTAGETNPNSIVANVADSAGGQVAIFSLAFGYNLDFDLLKKLAYRTGGSVKQIYDSESAGMQLKGFYQSIGSPLIYNVDITYPTNIIDPQSVTQTKFKQFFKGSELVVVGKILSSANEAKPWECSVTGTTADENIELTTTVDTVEISIPEASLAYQQGFVEKLFIYMKIKDLLRKVLLTDDKTEQTELENEALSLALEYHFVTPLTSMIIVQPRNSYNGDAQPKNSYNGDLSTLTSDGMKQVTLHIYGISLVLAYTLGILL